MRAPRGRQNHGGIGHGQPSADEKRISFDYDETITGGSSFHLFIRSSYPILRSIKTHALLLIALALGLVVRLVWLSAHSVLLDEATVAIGARDIVRNHTNIWDAMSNAPFLWMIGRMLGMSGLGNVFLLRLPSALMGVASIAALYWLAWHIFGKTVAGISALLFAVHPFAVAFSRVLFADPFQLFFVLLGCYGFERLAMEPWRGTSRQWALAAFLFVVWGFAFLMKYNAIVPGALWLASGFIARRYRFMPALVAFLAMAVGSFGTLLLWPYDAPIWFFAFMGKAGSYSFPAAFHYFATKLHLVFFGITEITFVAGFLVAWLLYRQRQQGVLPESNKTTAAGLIHLTLFLLLETAILIGLGRSFQRYLLVLVPFGCVLLAALFQMGWFGLYRAELQHGWGRLIVRFSVFATIGIFSWGAIRSYSDYFSYLHNDVDYARVARQVLALEQQPDSVLHSPRRAFWLVPEPIAGYYLGYSQRYSRAVRPNLDGATAYQNYFDFAGVPHADDWKGDKVLSIRHLAREWGIVNILFSPRRFLDNIKQVTDSVRTMPPLPVIEYLTDDFVQPNDLLIMQSGFIDLQGEPILENIEHEDGPPFIPTLPLSRFFVSNVYHPDGNAPVTDTTLTRVQAGVWILMRK